MKIKRSIIFRIITICLALSMALPMGVSAAVPETVQPMASDYLSTYNAYVYLPGDGEVRVYFDVQGTRAMDDIGALSISIYECSTNSSNEEDWTWVHTFTHDSTAGMLGHNTGLHCGMVSLDGHVGRYYKAYVCIWAGKNGDGDARYFWTSAKC